MVDICEKALAFVLGKMEWILWLDEELLVSQGLTILESS